MARRRSSGLSDYVAALKHDSSIGDVGTIRNRLQARRATLNEEIGKENQLRKGSKRLAGVSLDHKARDQAVLEMNFAESKIRALQAELTKINSSLQSYQSESCRDTQIPIVPLALKTSTKLSFVSSFSETISKHYHTDPSSIQDCIYDFQELRYSVATATRDDMGIEILYEYHNQLKLVGARLLHPSLRHGIAFVWYDAINGMPAAQQSTVFERACVLFNIAALHSQIAAHQDRSTPEGIDTTIKNLKKAIGCFEYMKDKFSHSPTLDMSEEMLALFSDLMRAQAQELVWEKQQLPGLKDDTMAVIDYAHKSKSVAECYRPVRELLDEDAVKEYLPDCWMTLIKVKDAHYKALAHYYAALAHEKLATIFNGGGQIAEEVRTELHFLYPVSSPDYLSTDPKYHIGLVKSHLNCATLSHEYALKYASLCRDLSHTKPLHKMLHDADARTRQKMDEVNPMEGSTVIAPAIQPAEVCLTPILPDFTLVKVQDMFHTLGPLPVFTAENSWAPPRTVTLSRVEGGFGFSVRGSKPITISGVDKGGQAEAAGVKPKDWVLAINGMNVKYKSHDEVVTLVKECREKVTLEITTPVEGNT